VLQEQRRSGKWHQGGGTRDPGTAKADLRLLQNPLELGYLTSKHHVSSFSFKKGMLVAKFGLWVMSNLRTLFLLSLRHVKDALLKVVTA
jgi:hypothetical protein